MPNTITKTANVSLIAWQDITNTTVIVGAAQDVSSKLAATFYVKVGRRSASAFTTNWPTVRIEASAKSSGNDDWYPITLFNPANGATQANTTLNGAVLAGATTFVVSLATNIAVGDVLFLGDTSTANYELVRVKAISGTTVTPEEAVTYAHANAAIVTDQAELYFASADLSAVVRVRAVVDNANSGQPISVQVLMVTADSIG
jgi:hypothetical protein